VENRNEHIINMLVSFLLVTYLYCTEAFKFCIQLIKIQWKHAGFHNETLKSFEYTSLCLCWKTTILSGHTFWSTLPCLDLGGEVKYVENGIEPLKKCT
jgi:hypothetical protein